MCVLYELMLCICFFFFFKQKTAYDMRISDWSSDVCSSDLHAVECIGLDHRIMRLVEEGEPLADPRAAGQAIVADDVAREAGGTAEPRGHALAALIEHRRSIGRFDHVGQDRKSTRLNSSH